MTSIGVGIIGTGVGLRSIAPTLGGMDGVTVVAVAGSSEERVVHLTENLKPAPTPFKDFREVCDNPSVDLIVIASPNEFHLEQASYAISTGKTVYCEKPVGVSEVEVRKLEAVAESSASTVVVGHQLRFNPLVIAIRDAILRGDVGRVYHVSVRQQGSGFTDPSRPWTWEFDSERTGGVRLAMGAHMVDLLFYLIGEWPRSVFGSLDPVHEFRTPDNGSRRRVSASAFMGASLQFSRCVADISTTAAAHGPFRFVVDVHGENGDIAWSEAASPLLYRRGEEPVCLISSDVLSEFLERSGTSLFSKSFGYLGSSLIESMRGKTTLERAATLSEARSNARTLDSIFESARTGSMVAVPCEE